MTSKAMLPEKRRRQESEHERAIAASNRRIKDQLDAAGEVIAAIHARDADALVWAIKEVIEVFK